jgi:hypothetical protein
MVMQRSRWGARRGAMIRPTMAQQKTHRSARPVPRPVRRLSSASLALLLIGCVKDPRNGTTLQHTSDLVTIDGYTPFANEFVVFSARGEDNGFHSLGRLD